MVKSTIFIKKFLALFLVVLMSIDSFAAVVSDNDGSAFITKAEFDSLRNTFQAQINKYNETIDSKIESAIGAYIAGVKSVRTTSNDIIRSMWDEIVCLGYSLKNTYQIPDYNLSYNAQFNGQPGVPDSTWNYYEIWNTWFNFTFKRKTNEIVQKRLLCDAGTEAAEMPDKIVWLGVALNLLETQTYNVFDAWTSNFNENRLISGYLSGTTGQAFAAFLPTYITWVNAGFYPNLQSSIKDIYQPGLAWRAGSSSTSFSFANNLDKHGGSEPPNVAGQLQTGSTEIKLLDVSGKKIDYEHIIYFDNVTTGYYTDVDWLRSLRIDPNATWVRHDVLRSDTGVRSLRGARRSLECNKKYNGTMKSVTSDIRVGSNEYGLLAYTGSYGNSDEVNKLPYLGVVNREYSADEIYQESGNVSVEVGSNIISKNTPDTLLEGAAILAGNAGDTIKWSPTFITKNNGVVSNYDVKVKLVVGTFGDNDTITSGSVVCKNSGQADDYLVTNGGTCSYNFVMPKTGVVFAKWWPADDSVYTEGKWEIALDIPNCSKYTRIEGES